MDDLFDQLETLTVPLRTAFAAGCAERVLVIYKYISPVYHRGPEKAIDTAWSIAQGVAVEPDTVESIRQEVHNALPDLDQDPELTPALYAGAAAGLALLAGTEKTSKSAHQAAIRAQNAVYSFDEESEEGVAEEDSWQKEALAVVKSWGNRPINRHMFDPINQEKPGWLARYEG